MRSRFKKLTKILHFFEILTPHSTVIYEPNSNLFSYYCVLQTASTITTDYSKRSGFK